MCRGAAHGAQTNVRKCPWHSVDESRHLARGRMHAYPWGIGATRLSATAPSNGAIHVVPKRPSLRVYDPFYARPPAARRTAAYPAPLFTDREGKQPSSVTCYCSYANRLHSWSTVVYAHTRAGSDPEAFAATSAALSVCFLSNVKASWIFQCHLLILSTSIFQSCEMRKICAKSLRHLLSIVNLLYKVSWSFSLKI